MKVQTDGYMVETPGTAPGSDPRITSAFMSIVRLPEHLIPKRFRGRVQEGQKRDGLDQTQNAAPKGAAFLLGVLRLA